MSRNVIRLWLLAGAIGAFALACSQDQPVAPKTSPNPGGRPAYSATQNFNDEGACMAADAYFGGFTTGMSGPTDLNCTANDVAIARAIVREYSTDGGVTYHTFDPNVPVTCDVNKSIFVKLTAVDSETTNTGRLDIGIWIATDGGNASTGKCNHYNLVNTDAGVSNVDTDECGDLTAHAKSSVDLGTLEAKCVAGSTGNLHIGSCISWTVSGGDRDCPASTGRKPADGGSLSFVDVNGNVIGGAETPNGFRFGTTPSEKSKCNCDGFDVPIRITGTIKIIKNTVGGDGSFNFTHNVGTNSDPTVSTPFSIQTSQLTGNQLFDHVLPGTYTVAETGPSSDWVFNSISCTGNGTGGTTTTTSTQTATIVIPNGGGNVECTFTNTKKPKLTLKKHVVNDNGGTANASAWTLTATGTGGFTGTGTPATGVDATVGPNNVNVGVQYTLSESGGPSGYSSTGIWSCAGGGTFSSPNKITLGVGDDVTCTITNDDVGPKLTLKKHVTNDNGGSANASAWTLTATGTGGFSGTGTPATGVDATLGPNTVNAGVQYTLTESGGPAGYSSTGTWSCTGGTFASPNKITLALNDDVTCTITNDDVAPKLTLKKHVINDNGGTANASAWTLTATGTGGFTGTGTPATGVDATLGPNNVTAAVQYTLTESGGPSGYTSTGVWSCTGGGTFVSPNKITLGVGDDVSCTITNDDVGPKLTLKKHVINDNGGTANASAWTLTATGSGGFSGTGSPATGVDATLGPNGVTANVQYTLSESGGPSGYSSTGVWSCTGGGTFVSPNKITLGVGDDVSCTITNDDVAPKLTLKKHVINDNGGTADASAWTLTATGSGGFSGTGTPATGVDATLGPNNVTAGVQYTLTESGGPSGYSSTGIWSCTGGTFASPNKVTLGVGADVTCTITNDDAAPKLTLKKHVVNDNGGTADASAWTLTATGTGGFSGTGTPATGVDATLGPNNVSAGVQYTLTESGGPSGYSSTGIWSCTGGTFSSPNKITLGLGADVTCTITNDDIAPKLTLKKHVINDNGGTANASAWTLTATGTGGFSGTGSPATGVDATLGPNGVRAAVQYTLSESGGPSSGYSSTGVWSCTGGTFASPNKITLDLAADVTCTITNDDQPATLTIVKTVKGTGGCFTFNTNSAQGIDATFQLCPGTDGSAQKVFSNLNAGVLRSITEQVTGGFVLTDLKCTDQDPNLVINPTVTQTVSTTSVLGGSVTCTFVNEGSVSQTTRTQGFWATHPTLTNQYWFTLPLADQNICPVAGRELTSLDRVLGGFWSDIAKTSTGKKRLDIDHDRMQLLQQLLAAILNHQAFGSSPTGGTSIQDAKNAFCGSDDAAIKAAQIAMATFNTSGDNGTFTPGGSADPKTAKATANYLFWDKLP